MSIGGYFMHAQPIRTCQKLCVIPRPTPAVADSQDCISYTVCTQFDEAVYDCDFRYRIGNDIDGMAGPHHAKAMRGDTMNHCFHVFAKSLKRQSVWGRQRDLAHRRVMLP